MPSWITESAVFKGPCIARLYSKRQAAEAMAVSIPVGSRDWGGVVRFSNGTALFITLEKGEDRYAKEHRYNDCFDGDLLYWDSRASHDKTSIQVRALRLPGAEVVAFARVGEKSKDGRTQAFCYLGFLDFVDWWGDKPIHFTWRLRDFPNGLSGTPELDALAQWRPRLGHEKPRNDVQPLSPYSRGTGRALVSKPLKEGAKGRVTANRYERDPRAREECLKSHGSTCFVCRFDFGSVYGTLGVGFIFVHHRIPLAIRGRGGEYELNPARDLIPICGNCHAMVHRRQANEDHLAIPPRLPEEAATRLLELRRLASSEEWESIE